MEGLCTIISFDNRHKDKLRHINAMADSLSDGESLKISKITGEYWALASCAWSEDHWQPITFLYHDEKLTIAGLADIYNLTELTDRHRIPQHDLGKMIAACYRTGKDDWPLQLRGNFAVIILDLEASKFQAATDRVGIRPLYWHKQGDTYYLASRLKAIRQVCSQLEVNPESVYAFMHHSMIPSPHTIYKNVEKLQPGFSLQADSNGYKLRRYWDITITPKLSDSENTIAEKIYESLSLSVGVMKNGIASSAELGCFLSGGTDSSSICGLLAKQQEEPVAAFSIGFPENGYDEMFYARVAAKAFHLQHREHYIQPDDVLNMLPKIIAAYDEPFGNASAIPTFFCAHHAAQEGIRYLLAGDGGDEVFAGNDRYGMQQLFRNYYKLPAALRKFFLEPLLLNKLEKLPISIFHKAGSYIRRAKMPEVERLSSYRYITDAAMFSPAFLEACDIEKMKKISTRHYDCLTEAPHLDRNLYLDMKLTITDNDLRKVTRMCELAHTRVRYPMLDECVVDLGFRIPSGMKLKGTKGLRHIFKKAFQDLLPQEILQKQKHGFGLPISQWLRSDPKIKEFVKDLLFDAPSLNRGYFKQGFIEKLWDLQLNDETPYYGSIVWQVFMLEAWHREHYEG